MVIRFQDLYKIRWFVLKLLKHFGQANFINKFFTRYSSNDLEMTSTLESFLHYFNFKSLNFLQMFCDMKTQNWFVFIWLVKLADLFNDMSIILSTRKLWWIFPIKQKFDTTTAFLDNQKNVFGSSLVMVLTVFSECKVAQRSKNGVRNFPNFDKS